MSQSVTIVKRVVMRRPTAIQSVGSLDLVFRADLRVTFREIVRESVAQKSMILTKRHDEVMRFPSVSFVVMASTLLLSVSSSSKDAWRVFGAVL